MPETEKFEHFQVLRRPDGSLWELGRGAMGVTYKAFDTNLRCDVALKVINPQFLNSETAQQRFLREARAAAQLRHPNVASVFHLGSASGSFFYAMEYVEGETVEHRVEQRGALEPSLAVRIARQVARALIAADKQKLVHRDIKPSNVMLVRDDDEDHLLVKVIDFGLAKSLVSGPDQSLTVTIGGFVGTPHFASPEQLEERDIDIRSDIYSLGATLWFMLAGKPPFQGSMASVIHQQLGSPLPPAVLATFHPHLASILRKCLAKQPADRFQTPFEIKQALDETLTELTSHNPAILAADVDHEPSSTSPSSDPERFATGQILQNRYEILGQSSLDATIFKVKDLRSTRVLAIRPLIESERFDTRQMADLKYEISRLENIRHPSLTEVYGIEPSDRGFILLSEWVRGFSFQDLLRARQLLAWDETLRLVRSLAKVLDFVADKHLLKTDLTLRQVYVDPADPHYKASDLERLPLTKWPPFLVKLDTLSLGTTLPSQFAGSAQTIVPGRLQSAARTAPQQLAQMIYELLGGTNPPTQTPTSSFRFSPLSALSEAGNSILRPALVDPTRFSSANEFLSALEQAEAQAKRGAISLHARIPPPLPDRPAAAPPESPPELELEEQPRTSRLLLRIVTAVVGAFLLVAVVCVLAISIFLRKSEPIKPTVRQGFVTITSKPEGAIVKSNGRELGQTPLIKYQLPVGKQVLDLEFPGYQPRPIEVEISNDSVNNLGQIVLVRDVGQFVIKTNPPGVPFQLIDSENKVTSGISPLTVENMPTGKYQVKIQRPGWPEVDEDVDLAANASVAIQHTFQGANVSLKSDPSGATIYLAGAPIGKTPMSYTLPLAQVELTSKIGSLAPVTQRFTPDPDGSSAIEFKHTYGLVSITSDRADAEVLIGGISLGHAPIEGILPPGRHQVVVTVSGSPEQARTAEIQANRRQVMQFTFGGGLSEANQSSAVNQIAPTVQDTSSQPSASPTAIGSSKPTNTVFHGNTFPTVQSTPSPNPSAVASRPRVSSTPVYRTKEAWEKAKEEAYRKFDSDWDARKDAMKQEKKYIEYWIDHSSGSTKDQWKSKKKALEDKMDRLDDQKDNAKDSLKKKWGDD
ncbi:MAG TPA: protein kinase [Chthoniobacterales bacterium]|nr:protein kinase [Chthoniobacterales bacterium]